MMTCKCCEGPTDHEGQERCEFCQYVYDMLLLDMEEMGMETGNEIETIGVAQCVMCDQVKELEDDGVCHRCSYLSILAIEQEMN